MPFPVLLHHLRPFFRVLVGVAILAAPKQFPSSSFYFPIVAPICSRRARSVELTAAAWRDELPPASPDEGGVPERSSIGRGDLGAPWTPKYGLRRNFKAGTCAGSRLMPVLRKMFETTVVRFCFVAVRSSRCSFGVIFCVVTFSDRVFFFPNSNSQAKSFPSVKSPHGLHFFTRGLGPVERVFSSKQSFYNSTA